MSETPGQEPEPAEAAGPYRVIGTPLGAPATVDPKAPAPEESPDYAMTDPADIRSAKGAERIAAACFVIAFLAGVGFLVAYIGLEVGSSNGAHSNAVVAALRSNMALGSSLGLALLALGIGSMIWVRHLTPNIEIAEQRHDLKSAPADRAAFKKDFAVGAARTQITKRPLLRRTMLLATAPLALAPLWLLRDLGPLPGTVLRHTAWKKGTRAVTLGGNRPLRPGDITTPGSLITVIPEGFSEDQDALAKAGVILIKFAPGELHVPDIKDGKTQLYTMNWTVDNIVAYSKICTHVGCPVALYEQTTHHILCPCHQSTFDAANGANVIFGPAARALPQLPLTVDADGYLVAASDFTQPVGPSFWERG
ncbi:MAG TPA: Rieske (2Fe-2S) protein [Trebonia sp.]|nr:Rieske (2Fe-2S) protein [Trebonia sp.]